MTVLKKAKFILEGKYAAEVEVELVVHDHKFSPCLSLEDAYKLDNIREALKKGNLKAAARTAKVYELHPVAV